MVYGVDVRTEVGYSYRMQADQAAGSRAAPSLEEIYFEEPCDATATGPPLPDEITLIDDMCYVNATSSFSDEFDDICRSVQPFRRGSRETDRSIIAIDKSCKSNIVAVAVKKISQKRRFLKKGEVHHSGDGSVPYVSLAYAHSWLEDGDERWEEHRPAAIHKSWSPLRGPANAYPATDIYYSNKRGDGDTTIVAEISGIDHIDICSNAYVHLFVVEPLVEKVYAEAQAKKAREDHMEVVFRNKPTDLATKAKKTLTGLAEAIGVLKLKADRND
jgi:hypothetical protein